MYDQEDYREYEIQIHLDDSGAAENPREWGGMLGTLVYERSCRYGGADEEVYDLDDARAELEQEYPGLVIVDTRHGFSYITPDDIRKEYSKKRISAKVRKTVEKVLEAEDKLFNAWADGEVFGYTVDAPNGDHISSCWGYYGTNDIPYAVECAKEEIDEYLAKKQTKKTKQVKAWIRHHVPLIYRGTCLA